MEASEKLKQGLEKNLEAKIEDIQLLKEWCSKIKLPELKDYQLLEFHHSCFYNITDTKNCIQAYFKIRRSAPQLFTKRDITTEPLRTHDKTVHQIMPIGATKEGYQILLCRLLTSDRSNQDYTYSIQQGTLAIETMLYKHGTFPGLIILIDDSLVTFKHIFWAKWSHLRIAMRYAQEGFPVRLHSVEAISPGSIAKYAIALLKAFTSNTILDKVTIHSPSDYSSIYEKIPIECLPKEYGGLLPSCDELHDDYLKDFMAMKSYFEEKDSFEMLEPS